MKKYIYFIATLLLVFSAGCNDDDPIPSIIPEASGTLTDKDGNEYGWVRYGGLDWMTSNFKEGTPYYDLTQVDEWGYEDFLVGVNNREQAIADYERFGNLYTYNEAVERTPEGWRLPTDEDWQRLEKALGMSEEDAVKEGWRGKKVGEILQRGTEEGGLGFTCSGFCGITSSTPQYFELQRTREYGYYWSSTTDESFTTSQAVYYRRIASFLSSVERESTTIREVDYLNNEYYRMHSVRYVRDAQ